MKIFQNLSDGYVEVVGNDFVAYYEPDNFGWRLSMMNSRWSTVDLEDLPFNGNLVQLLFSTPGENK